MLIFPAIDLYGGKAVRLFKGDYQQMTIYDDQPVNTALKFRSLGAAYIHLVDLEGAKDGTTPNLQTVTDIAGAFGGFAELGGGVRSLDTIEKYLSAGINRVILGTAAVTCEGFAAEAVRLFGSDCIAVGADLRDGYVSVKGWTESTGYTGMDFCKKMADCGVKTVICTDISRDGAMKGTNRQLYADMSRELDMNIVASGGVSTIDDVKALADMGLYAAIIGKAWYTGAIDLAEAIDVAAGKVAK